MAAIKVITDRERVGNEATRIVRAARSMQERGVVSISHHEAVRVITGLAGAQLQDALHGFAWLDTQKATRLIAQEKAVDHELRFIMRNLIMFMMEDHRTICIALETLWVAKAVERIGHHANNIAEYLVHVIEGKDIHHQKSALSSGMPASNIGS